MQVTHVSEKVTHALIGGGKTSDFRMSNNAEFFEIMSSTLYKNQKLAVAREVICNSWDAHIAAGITDKPIKITLNDEELIFQDFGPGIDPDLLVDIYTVYGESTKKHDGKQTGGFGLGSKSPFAYVDHFEVANCFEGFKTIYNMSKSSAMVNGVPGVTPIVTIPCDESGVTVTIKLKSVQDRLEFARLIAGVVRNGEILAEFNGTVLGDLIPFSQAKHGFILTKAELMDTTASTVFVRYGNVIYPVEKNSVFENEYDYIIQFLTSFSGDRWASNHHKIIFQAPPHSISVTPSREALSMKEVTTTTLKMLMGNFQDLVAKKVINTFMDVAKEETTKALGRNEIGNLLTGKRVLPVIAQANAKHTYMDINEVARAYSYKNYPDDQKTYKKDLTYRLKILAAKYSGLRGLYSTFIDELKKFENEPKKKKTLHVTTGYKWDRWSYNHWFQRRVLGQLWRKMKSEPSLDFDRLYIHDKEHPAYRWSSAGIGAFIPAKKYTGRDDITCYVPFLRNIVVVGPSKSNVTERMHQFPEMALLGKEDQFIFYQSQRQGTRTEDALNFFKNRGFHVIDLTVAQPWEEARHAPKPLAPVKPRKKGLPVMTGIFKPKDVLAKFGESRFDRIDILESKKETAPRIDNPEFVLHAPVGSTAFTSRIQPFEKTSSTDIVILYGAYGGIAHTGTQEKAWIAKGAKPFKDYILEKLDLEMRTNPRIIEYQGYNYNREPNLSYDVKETLKLISKHPALREEFGLVNNLTVDDVRYIRIYQDLMSSYQFQHLPARDDLKKYMDAIPKAKEFTEAISLIEKSKFLGLISIYNVEEKLGIRPVDPVIHDGVVKLLTQAIKG